MCTELATATVAGRAVPGSAGAPLELSELSLSSKRSPWKLQRSRFHTLGFFRVPGVLGVLSFRVSSLGYDEYVWLRLRAFRA